MSILSNPRIVVETSAMDLSTYLLTIILFLTVVGFVAFSRGYELGITKPSEFLERNCVLGYNTTIETQNTRIFCVPVTK